MAEWLILQLPRNGESSCSWMTVDAGGHALDAPVSGAVADAVAAAAGRRVALVWPAATYC